MKYSVKIGLHLKPNNKGEDVAEEVAIRLRVSWSGFRADLRSGFVIAPSKWDAANDVVKPNTKNKAGQTAGEINREIAKRCTTIEEIFARFELEDHHIPSVQEFRTAYDLAVGRIVKADDDTDFFLVYDKFTAAEGYDKNWTDATFTKFASLRSHLKAWRSSISLSTFSKADFADFVKSYLIKRQHMLNPSIDKNIGFLRWFLRWACANGYYNGLAHLQYRPRLPGLDCKEVIYLEWEELQSFLHFEFPDKNPSFPPVRDVFCFCCFTGLRYSDVAKLRRSDLHLSASPPYMVVITKKTNDRLHIELNKYALSILDKYKDVRFPRGLALPIVSNVKMNEHLHDAAEAAGINDPVRIVQFSGNTRTEQVVPKYAVLTTHAGRRTFIVNGLRLGIPAPVIMEWTGHSDYKAMKPYIKIVDAAKIENMAKFDTFGEIRNDTEPT
jgi:integrase